MTGEFSTAVIIEAAPEQVWAILTDTRLMPQWMGTPEMKISVQTSWKINTPLLIRGFLYSDFENKGIVLQYDKYKKLSYSHLSSVSRLTDTAENYTILEFILAPYEPGTRLTLRMTNFPTEVIQRHLEFYWRTAIVLIKRNAEKDNPGIKTTLSGNYK